MSAVAFEHPSRQRLILTFATAFLVLAAQPGAEAAPRDNTFVIPASEGYGIQDCLSKSPVCARKIADTWCEAHGLTASVAFGLAEDITGTTKDNPETRLEPGSFIVTCRK
jgi:hypothetical protein